MNEHAYSSVKTMFGAYKSALDNIEARLSDAFYQAVDLISAHQGNLIVCGMGKSGLVGQKITATLTSTGTPTIFLHPAEAIHGDLGVVRQGDVIILISNSGETEEVVRLLPALRRLEARMIALVGNTESTLAKAASVVLDASIDKEACPLNLAPTTSTLAALVLGDALAIALMRESGFTDEDFARTHPGGKLGRKLLSSAQDHMRTHDLPFVPADMAMTDVIIAMTEGRLGLALVGSHDGLEGLITDGDLRRMLVSGTELSSVKAGQVMNPAPQTITPDMPLGQAEELMLEAKIQCLVVADSDSKVLGVLQIF